MGGNDELVVRLEAAFAADGGSGSKRLGPNWPRLNKHYRRIGKGRNTIAIRWLETKDYGYEIPMLGVGLGFVGGIEFHAAADNDRQRPLIQEGSHIWQRGCRVVQLAEHELFRLVRRYRPLYWPPTFI